MTRTEVGSPRRHSSAVGLVLATHALPSAAVTTFVTALGVRAGASDRRAALLAGAVLSGQASVGWLNDLLDADRDRMTNRPDKPLVRGEVTPAMLRRGIAGAGATCVPLSLVLGRRAGLAHLAAVGSAWAYDLGLKRTALSPLPYLVSFGLVPVIVARALPGTPAPRWPLVGAAAALGVGAHFANTVGDEQADAATGVRGLPQRLGPRRSTQAAAGGVGLGALLALAVTGARPVPVLLAAGSTALAVGGVASVERRGPSRWAFRQTLGAAGLLVAAILTADPTTLVR